MISSLKPEYLKFYFCSNGFAEIHSKEWKDLVPTCASLFNQWNDFYEPEEMSIDKQVTEKKM